MSRPWVGVHGLGLRNTLPWKLKGPVALWIVNVPPEESSWISDRTGHRPYQATSLQKPLTSQVPMKFL